MARTKREYVLATCFLSGAAAILSFVALGTQEWITADAVGTDAHLSYVKFGLFGGIFQQNEGYTTTITITTTCAWDLNICALLCGTDPEGNLRKLYNNEEITEEYDITCSDGDSSAAALRKVFPRASDQEEKVFINTGIWFCTILFLVISALMGLVSAALAVWNTATSPHQVYLSIFGLYIYNAVASVSILLSIILWGVMFAQDLTNNIPTFKTFLQSFVTKDHAQLGYSYWINLVSLIFYLISICLLYVRNYLISREPEQKVELETSEEPVIYLY